MRRAPALVLTSGLVLAVTLGCLSPHAVRVTRVPLRVGETVVTVALHEGRAAGLTYLNVHDDENTAVEAALDVVARRGGRVVTLEHTGARNVTFRLGAGTYTFDPNRMFTDAGAVATLRREGAYSPAARAAVRAFADSLLALLDPSRLRAVVTVHNNTEAAYSARSYAEGGAYAADARAVSLAPGGDEDDFFFVTDAGLFERLREAGFHVVLQDNRRATDDGSLSVYAGRAGLPYANAEAQHGHAAEQVRMLDALHAVVVDGGSN